MQAVFQKGKADLRDQAPTLVMNLSLITHDLDSVIIRVPPALFEWGLIWDPLKVVIQRVAESRR